MSTCFSLCASLLIFRYTAWCEEGVLCITVRVCCRDGRLVQWSSGYGGNSLDISQDHFLTYPSIITTHAHYFFEPCWLPYVPSTPRSAHTVYLCVLCGSENKQRLFPYIALTDRFLGSFAILRQTTISSIVSVRPSIRMEELGFHRTEFCEIGHLLIFLRSVEKIQVSLKCVKNNGSVREERCAFLISRSFLHTIRNDSDKIWRENQDALFVLNNFFLILPFMR
jgi:hypothetical protein